MSTFPMDTRTCPHELLEESSLMASASGLSKPHRIHARDRTVHAWKLGYDHRSQISYTQKAPRWEGIAKHCDASKGQFPRNADCSAFVTWGLWNGLYLPYQCKDNVNGENWTGGGYTGTLLEHGKLVHHWVNAQRADVVIYGSGGTGEHTAGVAGIRKSDGKIMVFSHGSEAGPFYLPYDYRKDIMCIRRYI